MALSKYADTIKSVALFSLALLFPLAVFAVLDDKITTTQEDAYVATCQGTNAVRTEFTNFVQIAVDRAEQVYAATVASAKATEKQKETARQNLEDLQNLIQSAKTNLPVRDCTYPPKKAD